MSPLALDTSVAIPLLVATHREHAAVVTWCGGRDVALSGHAVVETYSVLTRLPGDLRVLPDDAARLLRERFAAPLVLSRKAAAKLPTHWVRWRSQAVRCTTRWSRWLPLSTGRNSRRVTGARGRLTRRSVRTW